MKIDLIIEQGGGRLVSLALNISETKHATKNLTDDIIVTLKVLIVPKKKHILMNFRIYISLTCQSYSSVTP